MFDTQIYSKYILILLDFPCSVFSVFLLRFICLLDFEN